MKKLDVSTRKIKLYFLVGMIVWVLSWSLSFAQVPFEYNIVPEIKNNSVVDKLVTTSLVFNLYEEQGDIFYNNSKVQVKDNSFMIDISKMSGQTSFTFNNGNGEERTFSYNISDNKGKLVDYVLVSGKDLNTYVTTSNGIQVIYTDKEKNAVSKLSKYLKELPESVLSNVKQIKMIPYSHVFHIDVF